MAISRKDTKMNENMNIFDRYLKLDKKVPFRISACLKILYLAFNSVFSQRKVSYFRSFWCLSKKSQFFSLVRNQPWFPSSYGVGFAA